MPPIMNATAQKLPFLRYCKWRWLHFRRTWTDTRADRTPSWSRFYLRAYFRLLSVAILTAVVVATALAPGRAGQIPGVALILIAAVTFGFPALIAYRWMRPVWHDLTIIRERASDFTGGRFNIRARVSHSVIIGPLARMLNALAARMERIIAAQRELTNGISHELRTPLARVRFALEILRQPGSAAEYDEALAGIGQDVTELEELIDMSLTYARLEHSSLQSNLEATPLLSWFDKQVHDATLLYTHMRIVRDVDINPCACVAMDTRLMSYAMRNLLRNASKYAQARIVVGLSVQRGHVHIFVEDDGAGVPEHERDRIFDPFVRLDRQTGGYGIGLAITRQVLNAHRGHIAVTDPVTLSGARFELSWPVSAAA
ncbi:MULTISPECIES: ATP-binding protein [Burkholderiaceae]|jgi:two-component system OmpR family sensor kinase|uniref:histidine kinase n=1 Tax=Caballeronia sordidicola TaxID=196367 RepID=A0A242MU73_CABSO|nr:MULTISPECIES: ATP-binding protein [Burkholderiaceae]OTP74989.1 Sensory histidine kinase in two-component regulatory system with RstA [Caballeronia sordidicola]